MNESIGTIKTDICNLKVSHDEIKNSFNNNIAKISSEIQDIKSSTSRISLEQNNVKSQLITEIKYFAMDLQKVILLPKMPQYKDFFFLSRLIAFNLTFAPIQKKSSDHAVCVVA